MSNQSLLAQFKAGNKAPLFAAVKGAGQTGAAAGNTASDMSYPDNDLFLYCEAAAADGDITEGQLAEIDAAR